MNLISAFLILGSVFLVHAESDCVYDLTIPSNRPKITPFVIEPLTRKHFPILDGELRIPYNYTVLLECDFYDGKNKVQLPEAKISAAVTCSDSNILKYSGYYDRYSFKDINCKQSQFFLHAYNNPIDTCNKTKVAVAYVANKTLELNTKVFVDFIGFCFDKPNSVAVYSHIQLNSKPDLLINIVGGNVYSKNVIGSNLIELKDSQFTVPNIRHLYSKEYVNKHINSIIDNELLKNPQEFVTASFVEKEDLPTIHEDGTKFEINRLLMAKNLARGNWDSLMKDIRYLGSTSDLHLTLDIYTGTYGILSLPDKYTDYQPVYLQDDPLYEKVIPVPKYIWKVVYNSELNEGVAFIGLNDPYADFNSLINVEFCPNVCHRIAWLKQLHSDYTSNGFIFCCQLSDFSKTVESMPVLGNGRAKLLTH